MDAIVPSRTLITQRFPTVSFFIRVPERRCYEVACATDPHLLHPSYAPRRERSNFYASGRTGMIVGRRDGNTYVLPSAVVRCFGHAPRIYYALATRSARDGSGLACSIAAHELEYVPFVQVAPGVGPARFGAVFGSPIDVPLRWCGDDALARGTQVARSRVTLTCPGTRSNYTVIVGTDWQSAYGIANPSNVGSCNLHIVPLDASDNPIDHGHQNVQLRPGESLSHYTPPAGTAKIAAACSSLCAEGTAVLEYDSPNA